MLRWKAMTMKTVVKTDVLMGADGSLTVPAAAREAIEIEGAMLFDLELIDGRLALRPVVAIPMEDLWAYTPEHVARVETGALSGRPAAVRV